MAKDASHDKIARLALESVRKFELGVELRVSPVALRLLTMATQYVGKQNWAGQEELWEREACRVAEEQEPRSNGNSRSCKERCRRRANRVARQHRRKIFGDGWLFCNTQHLSGRHE